ncbi:hypothetical protein JCM24511_09243 [Saitozyma sp. JCM 24511]|nr:hypothetical protein JCM24511_09243 [Saitozyma sp. JCM 24511]
MSFESRPLLPKKTIPSPVSSARTSHMSKPLGTPSTPTAHAATMLASLPSKVSSRATTPTRNVSAGVDARFKVPALPSRLMTPSTSTVAHSSSPRRTGLSSSPPRETTPPPVQLSPGLTLVFGRHRHHAPGSSAKPPSTSAASATKLTTSVPRHLLHLLFDASPSRPAEIVHLPRTASHASRVHATVEYIATKDSLRIVVIGQNGLRVKRAGTGSRRLKSGQRMDMARGDGAATVQIDFYGCKVDIAFPAVEEPPEALFSPMSSPISAPPSPATSMPPSSPPMMPPSSPIGDHSSPLPIHLEAGDHARSIKQELLNAALESHDDLIVATDAARTVKPTSRPTTPAPQTREPAPPTLSAPPAPPAPPAPLPDGVDLAAILASTVVFSGSSKLSLPDLVKHMLETQPSLREHGDEQRWTCWAKVEVEGNAMFGKVERHGKDASGHPLLPHYFYNPAHDPDTNRAKQLGGLVRPLRAAQRAGGKAIDWRPVGGGRRR